ncbi:hypothetical protein [Cellulomonas sp. KH9]|uniref:hypothetical protein n=1 Tax=Cellulomonas sp. KH9 TaxID=1855324 RepID=UPI0008E93978|nr:hypothetical protein [Cellulomonas sp. KH9]SFK46836.1 hypothetical protein SAMN05216467_3459 [Cellulomonas sp. KH9]
MARTIPFPFIEHMPSLGALLSVDAFGAKVHELIDEYTLALGDVDKAGDLADASFHAGRLDALEQSLVLLLDVPQDVWEAHHGR